MKDRADLSALNLMPVIDLQAFRDVPFSTNLKFRQLVVTGPPGCGKSTLIKRIGGWPEEGYVDLAVAGWWKAHAMSLRPREVHLGLPFVGCRASLALFESDWLEAYNRLELDLARICLPPRKRFFWSVDWSIRYAFEFLLPEPERIFAMRQKRARQGTHPVDEHLDLDQIRQQVAVFAQVARHFHHYGLQVYLRADADTQPYCITAGPTD